MWKLIEQYIIDNRSEIDLDEPSEHLWDQIEKNLGQTKKKKLWNASIWKVAAAIIFIVGMGGSLYMNYIQSEDISLKSLKSSLLDWHHHDSYPELSKQDSAYATYAQQLLRKINGYDLDTYPFVSSYRKQLDKLGNRFEDLKSALQDQEYNQELQNEISKTFEQKIALLERLLGELESARQSE